MASVAPGPLAAGGAARSLQPLPIGELKSLFINFLEQHGYAVPQEANIILDNAVHCLSGSGRGPSPCPSVASNGKRSSSAISSDELSSHSDGTVKGSDVEEGPFQTVIAKRKNRKVARRQRKISNNSSNSDMEIETRQLKPTTKTDSPASPDPHQPKRRSLPQRK
ncbi:hypothetical protein EVAR_66261_1 [Eumeta japonica]|uniref:Uncharacterized protein n=1 Tax=Eumeta variegata TaxID=151549 RepID=A0A4C1ZWD8_EUMVA|nr:hypothetical protein EVAR_66261_1 [Eumeta japonica]